MSPMGAYIKWHRPPRIALRDHTINIRFLHCDRAPLSTQQYLMDLWLSQRMLLRWRASHRWLLWARTCGHHLRLSGCYFWTCRKIFPPLATQIRDAVQDRQGKVFSAPQQRHKINYDKAFNRSQSSCTRSVLDCAISPFSINRLFSNPIRALPPRSIA